MLLEQPQVCAWVAASFAIVLVDEGQDLKPERLRMLKALAGAVHALIAADEFQCLDQALRPDPLVAWLQQGAEPETLVQVRRTNAPGLLAAATAIRSGNAPVNGAGFKLLPPGASVPLATTLLANAIAWRQGGDVAVITPALQGGFATSVVARFAQGPCGRNNKGLTPFIGKVTTADEAQAIIAGLDLAANASAAAACAALRAMPRTGPARATLSWVENQVRACGRANFTVPRSRPSSRGRSRCDGSMVAARRIC